MVTFDKDKLVEQLDLLKSLPNIKEVKLLRKRLQQEIDRITKKEKVVEIPVITQSKTNISRSSKLKKYHRYLRMIRDNFPDLSYGQIRRQFSLRKQGFEADIPDVIWQNPSP